MVFNRTRPNLSCVHGSGLLAKYISETCETLYMNSKNSRKQPENKTISTEAIQKRAYELFVERGQDPGHELEDWLRAENEISSNGKQQKGGVIAL